MTAHAQPVAISNNAVLYVPAEPARFDYVAYGDARVELWQLYCVGFFILLLAVLIVWRLGKAQR
jgi:hypothetical protein